MPKHKHAALILDPLGYSNISMELSAMSSGRPMPLWLDSSIPEGALKISSHICNPWP